MLYKIFIVFLFTLFNVHLSGDQPNAFSWTSIEAKQKLSPYLIPENHPMKVNLDAIFLTNRATATHTSFRNAGFIELGKTRPRSFIKVASHPLLDSHLVKVYLDCEQRVKKNKESWYWLVKRCKGARKIRHIIKTKKIKNFVVSDKWIYLFPNEPSPPQNKDFTRHAGLLLVTDMDLASPRRNRKAWKEKITKCHLNELYTIISEAKGSSYRPDNIAYTKNGKFAFIDTEYPDTKPDFESIREFLSKPMQEYWDELVKNKGQLR